MGRFGASALAQWECALPIGRNATEWNDNRIVGTSVTIGRDTDVIGPGAGSYRPASSLQGIELLNDQVVISPNNVMAPLDEAT